MAIRLLAAAEGAAEAMESQIASDCAWCGGEGRWTEEAQPQLAPVRHADDCPYAVLVAAIARHKQLRAELAAHRVSQSTVLSQV